MSLLKVNDCSVWYADSDQYIVDHVNLEIENSSVTALVGESGSGKSTLGYAIMGLLQFKEGALQSGKICYNDKEMPVNEPDYAGYRGSQLGYVFQEPLLALNPVYTIGQQIVKVLKHHHIKNPKDTACSWLEQVGLGSKRIYKLYPHQLSGGMRQRAMIALALAANPELIIADEPTSGIDAVLKYDIMSLLTGLVKQEKSLLFITHDIAIASHFSDYIYVMKKGSIVESGKTVDIIRNPGHEYTQLLVSRFKASMQQFENGYYN